MGLPRASTSYGFTHHYHSPSPSAAPATPVAVELNERDLAILHKVAMVKYLTSLQIKKLFWPEAQHQTAAKRLNQLTEAGFLARRFMDSRATDERLSPRIAVYYWPKPAQTQLRTYVHRQGLDVRWVDFAQVIKPHAHVREVSSLFLRHETSLTEIYLNLEEAVARQGWSILCWLRPGPQAKDVSRWVQIDPQDPDAPTVHVGPDVVFCLADAERRLRLGVLEYESRDKKKTARAYRRRLEGHIAFAAQGCFAELVGQLVAEHQIPLQADPRTVGMFSLTVTSDQKLRDDFFTACASLHSSDVELLLTSLGEITPDTALSAIWLRAPVNAPIARQPSLLSGESSVVHTPLAPQDVAMLPRVSLHDSSARRP